MFPIADSVKAKRFPLVNISLIIVTAVVFILQITSADPDGFIMKYALIPSLVDLSNFSTLLPFITSMFLHGGFLHIISNMVFLWVFGDNVEASFSLFTYLAVYIFSGLVGGFAQYLLSPDSTIPMLGASGAVAGALGAYFTLYPHHRIKTIIPVFGFFTVTEISASVMLGYWFVLQIISGAVSLPFSGEQSGVAFFAHIGGFATGFILAKLFAHKDQSVTMLERYE